MTVIAHDPYVPGELASRVGVRLFDLAGVLAESDVVSLHLPLTPETTKLLDERAFSGMKRGAVLVNTSRRASLSHGFRRSTSTRPFAHVGHVHC